MNDLREMSNLEIAQLISERIGDEPIPFNSVHDLCEQIYNELGGEPEQFDNVYEILLRILFLLHANVPYILFKANANSTVGIVKKSYNQTLEYSTNLSNWQTMDTSTSLSLQEGDKVYVRGILSANNMNTNYTQFSVTGNVSLSGNINAVWNYQDLTASLKECCGYYMFYECRGITNINELCMPSKTLAYECYCNMFDYCSGLTSIPSNLLPATTLAAECYFGMFAHCIGLTSIPSNLLPATTLTDWCYMNMFYGCMGLTTIPSNLLPATTLAKKCYEYMFSGCIHITNAPELPATTLAEDCYSSMFSDCASLTAAPELPATTLAKYCYVSMFSYCYSLTAAPELPAKVLTYYCYKSMFRHCPHLNYVKCLATDISADSCTTDWLESVSETGTFVKDASMNDWTTGINGIPSGWTVQNA